tara:strand:- start:8916 stop:9167 length:252 start_codon:yes stop_codon:yes gene_type:complete
MKLEHELKPIAALCVAYSKSKEDIIDLWNSGEILVFDKEGLSVYYDEVFEGYTAASIARIRCDDLRAGKLVEIDNIFFYCEWV